MVEIKSLDFAYPGEPPLRFPDFSCEQGAQWLILGQSGTGKTTLLHLLAGLLTPSSGSLRIADTDMTTLSETERDAFRGQNIGIVFQKTHLLRTVNVLKNLVAAQFFAKMPQKEERALALLQRLQLEHKAKSKVENLSEGERQRVGIARALINRPKLILADEPTSSLDDNNCREVVRLLKEEAAQQNATLLIVTHDARLKSEFEQHLVLRAEDLAARASS